MAEKHKVYTCGDPACDTEASSAKNIRIHQTKSGHQGEPRISTRSKPAKVTRSQQAIARKKAAPAKKAKATTKTTPRKKSPAKKAPAKKSPAKKKAAAKRAPARKSRAKK